MKQIRAIIADDEEILRMHLRSKLALIWPELVIAGEAGDGEAAHDLILDLKPDIAFLDIRMPGMSGIDVARAAAGTCLSVFVTAHDQYAIEAFEREAVDYLLKPVTEERLEKTVRRLRDRLSSAPPDLSSVLEGLSAALRKSSPQHLQWIKAQHRDSVRLVPVADIFYFKSADKYTSVRTRDAELLIRKTLTELERELDSSQFWRVHRAAIVNAKAVFQVKHDNVGSAVILFKDISDQLPVSRAYTSLFKQM